MFCFIVAVFLCWLLLFLICFFSPFFCFLIASFALRCKRDDDDDCQRWRPFVRFYRWGNSRYTFIVIYFPPVCVCRFVVAVSFGGHILMNFLLFNVFLNDSLVKIERFFPPSNQWLLKIRYIDWIRKKCHIRCNWDLNKTLLTSVLFEKRAYWWLYLVDEWIMMSMYVIPQSTCIAFVRITSLKKLNWENVVIPSEKIVLQDNVRAAVNRISWNPGHSKYNSILGFKLWYLFNA